MNPGNDCMPHKANLTLNMREDGLIKLAAEAICEAEALLITAGAGMGVDSGLPDFRGNEGFWNAYPPYRHLGLSFVELANPRRFRDDPALAWGFYGHRLNLYRATPPHAGFQILRGWGQRTAHGPCVFTSNVDGHFQRAGFADDSVTEAHGSIHHAQCLKNCGVGIFSTDAVTISIDETSFRANSLPRCPRCDSLARPNILMFGDNQWDDQRIATQKQRQNQWIDVAYACRLVVIELGAGMAIPTVRRFSERLAIAGEARLIRINLRESQVPDGHIGLSMGALSGLQAIKMELNDPAE